MSIYLHAYSALPILDELEGALDLCRVQSLTQCSAKLEEDSPLDLRLRRTGLYRRPLHVLVDHPNKRQRKGYIISHVWSGDIPRDSFRRYSESVFVSSPEFSFLQMASCLDVIELIRLGYELCGYYRLDNTLQRGFREAEPLTTRKKLSAYLRSARGCPGVRIASSAVNQVIDSSRSPRETALSMMLHLQSRSGGWQMGDHELNYRIEVGGDVEGYLNRYVDIYWPGKRVGLEYDSDSFHLGEARITRDSVREKVLADQGIELMRITNEELLNPAKRRLAFSVLAKALGIRKRSCSQKTHMEREKLAARLLSPHLPLY